MKIIHVRSGLYGSLLSVVLSFFAGKALALSSSDGGTIQLSGEYQTQGGQATYSMPLDLPGGRTGFQPRLNLRYRSNSPNGLLGMGWQLDERSAISRCGQNLITDGRWGGINFDVEDRFCLDGQRLIAITGMDGGQRTEYRVEKNGYAKVISYGSLAGGPKYFKVWRRDGSVREYGMTTNARAALPGKSAVYQWQLNKHTDSTGQNTIRYTYQKLNTTEGPTLSGITYAGGKVSLAYEARTDIGSAYFGGVKLTKNHRLSTITTYDSAGSIIGHYHLTYQYASGTERSLLQQVRYCASGGQCSTPVTFDWQSEKQVELGLLQSTGFKSPRVYDADGGGNATLYGVVAEDTKTGKMTIKDLQGKTRKSVTSFTLNGKVYAPTLKLNQCKVNAASSYLNASGEFEPFCQFSGCTSDSCKYASKGVNAGDFDGDGGSETITGYLTADFNGDGRDDKHRFDIPKGGYQYIISGGISGTLPSAGNRVLKALADINQDGYLDVVMGPSTGSDYLYAYLFTGKGFTSPTKLPQKVSYDVTVVFGDMNGDGYQELGANKKLYLNKRGTITDTVLLDIQQDLYALRDINGDGWLDVMSRASKTAKVDKQISTPQVQDKITGINEFGVQYGITYLPATDADVYTTVARKAFPVQGMTPTRYLVSQVIKHPEGYQATTYRYQYLGAKSHLAGGGFLGFEKITETETATVTSRTETVYEQLNVRKAGNPLTTTVYKNGQIISSVSYQYRVVSHSGLKVPYYQVYASDITKKQFLLKDSSKVEKLEHLTQTMDAFGNITQETRQYSSGLSGGGSYTSTTNTNFLSKGSNQSHYVYQLDTKTQNSMASLFQDYKAGLGQYCTESGEIYLKPNDLVVLIGNAVLTPIVAERYDQYFKYTVTTTTNATSGLSTHSGHLTRISKAEFNKAAPYPCGNVNLTANVSGKLTQLTAVSTISPELITESPGRFWRLSAPVSQTTTLKDNSTGLSHTTRTQLAYTNTGLISRRTVTGSDYDSKAMSGKTLTENYHYDRWGNITEQSVSGTGLTAARRTRYQYSGNGLYLQATTNAAGHRYTSSYNARGLLTKNVDSLKSRTSGYKYDTFGRIKTQTLPGSDNTMSTEYKLGTDCPYATTKTVSCLVTEPESGGKTVTLYDYAGREVRQLHQAFKGQWVSTETSWDTSGRKVRITRPHFVNPKSQAPYVTFSYDLLDRETEKSEPSSSGSRAVFTTQYNGLTTTSKDAKGNQHHATYNVMGYVTRKDEPLSAYQTYQYYPDGKLKSTTDSAGNITRITYDALGYRTSLDDPNMGKWRYTYNALGELTYKRDENGKVTTIAYDTLGRKVKQVENGNISVWQYDGNSAPGTLTRFSGNGNTTEYAYNSSGLTEEVAVTVGKERFSTHYVYDGFERLTREIRPNGNHKGLIQTQSSTEKLAVEYVYNPYGYLSAVRSPRSYADKEFTSTKFRSEIRQLLEQALAKANEYLSKAEHYHQQTTFYTQKAEEYRQQTTNEHQLDSSSVAMLGREHKFQQWCSDDGECYLLPVGWMLLGINVSIPVEAVINGDIYRLDTDFTGTSSTGNRMFDTTLHRVSSSEFKSQTLTRQHDFVLVNRGSGKRSLLSEKDVYVAEADPTTQEQFWYTAEDLEEAAELASRKQQYFTDLADSLISLSEQVAVLSGLYCEDAKKLGGKHSRMANKWRLCGEPTEYGQADTLQLVLDQSQLEASKKSQAYIYYWQRSDTDAYDHTLSEVLGNGLVNSYQHNAATGRSYRIETRSGRKSLRALHYQYDRHNNVTSRYDEQLGITDNWTYDAQDRVISNRIALTDKTRHGVNNPDVTGPFTYRYDKLGNLTFKTGIGNYQYNTKVAGPHAVVTANGLTYQYDKVGNLLRAYKSTGNTTERTLTWTAFNKPASISRDGNKVEFFYDANHNRYLKKSSDGTETFYFGKTYERITSSKTGESQHKHFVYADGKLIALNTQIRDKSNKLKNKQVRYLHYNALNSVDMITDGYGNVVERRSYDTWGKQRAISWRSDSPAEVLQSAITNRGYTGHEEITEVNLIHMNGRVYDQQLGRFLSADPHIQAPYLVNSFNRYSYVMNNPLKYTDPTGFFWSEVGEAISSAWSSVSSFFSGSSSSSGGSGGNDWASGGGSEPGKQSTVNQTGDIPDKSKDNHLPTIEQNNSLKREMDYLESVIEEQNVRTKHVKVSLDASAELQTVHINFRVIAEDAFNSTQFETVVRSGVKVGYKKGPLNIGTDGSSVSGSVNFRVGYLEGEYSHDTLGNKVGSITLGPVIKTPVGDAGAGVFGNSTGNVGLKAHTSLGNATAEVYGAFSVPTAIKNIENFINNIDKHVKEAVIYDLHK
nr:RHS repeat-associated core domain-containing protein [uncultured Vibrio sp.]